MKTDFSDTDDIKKLFRINSYDHTLNRMPKRSDYIIVYPPTIDWGWMKQRPQHLMEQFSLNGFDVYYCNKTQSRTSLFSAVYPNLYVIHNHNYFIGNMIPMLKKQGKKILLWVSWARLHTFLKAYRPDFIIYDYLDDFDVWKPYHNDMVGKANIVVASSTALHQQIQQHFPDKKCYLVPNGCDTAHFARPVHLKKKPYEFGKHDGPVITYIGAWAHWIDQELVYKAAEEFVNALVVIIGAELGTKVCRDRSNLKYLGYKDYNSLPQYLHCSTVCLMPFKIQDMTMAVNPIKMYEYLASGTPVVSTDIPEARNIPYIYIGKDHASFIHQIRMILDGEIEFSQHEADVWLKKHTWEKRFMDILVLLKENGIHYKEPKILQHRS